LEEEVTQPKLSKGLIKRLMGLIKPWWKLFALATTMAVLTALLMPLRPYLIQLTVDNEILKFDVEGLINMSILLVGVLLAESVVRYLFNYTTRVLGQTVIRDLRMRVFDHLIHLKLKYFDNTPIGRATTRTVNDVETINDIFSQGITAIIADVLTILTVMAVMFYTDWQLTLVCLSVFPILIYVTYIFKERIKDAFHNVRAQVSRLNAFLQEHITGMKIVQIFNAEDKEMNKFQKINDDYKQANIRAIWYFSIFFPVVEVLSASAMGLVVWYGANNVIQYQTTLGVLIAFIMYLQMLFRPLRALADKFNILQMGLVASERVFNLLDRDDYIPNHGTVKPSRLRGRIDFNRVWFAYNSDQYVLKDISFTIQPGETLAIVGATGSGKTSIINILNRFYPINSGNIKVDDIELSDYEIKAYRSQLAIVLQDVFLFSGSVMDNITLYNDNISREEVIKATKMIGAHDFIMKLPGQYEYNVGERGSTLSLGQRQLISFIRALVYDPSILILDEATSSIDTESEMMIQQAIEKLVQDRTSIVIAHRLSTIQNADKILVLDHGQIMEMGSHDELLKKGGYYKELYEQQFKKEEQVG
jgi:ATP-binding cassette subfamily B protein